MKNNKKNIIQVALLFFLLFLIVSFITLFLSQQKIKKIPKFFIQKPVNKIKLPYGNKINIPYGFTVFESKIDKAICYSFIKYIPEWKNNNFVKIDMTIINKKYLDISVEKFGKSDFDFDMAIIKPKINLSDEFKKIRKKFNEDTQIYDIDYSQFKPQHSINGKINNQIWRRYTLQLYEPNNEKETTIIKLWNNLYTVFKDYIYIFDYVCDAGIKINNNKYAEKYSQSVNGIDKMVQGIISSIEFK